MERIVDARDVVEFGDEGAVSTEVAESEDAAVFVWGVRPGQEVPLHVHPAGQDTWVMVAGELTYRLGDGETERISAGEIDVAPRAVEHGAVNEGDEDAVFVSVHSGPDIGYEEIER